MTLAALANEDFRLIAPGTKLPDNIVATHTDVMTAAELRRVFDALRDPKVDVVHCSIPDPSSEFKAHYQWQRNQQHFYVSSAREVTFHERIPLVPFIKLKAKGNQDFFPAAQASAQFVESFEADAFTKSIAREHRAQWLATPTEAFEAVAQVWPDAITSFEADGTSFFNRMTGLAFHRHTFSNDLMGRADRANNLDDETFWRQGFYMNNSLSDDGTVFMGSDGEHYYSWGWGWNLFKTHALHSTPVLQEGQTSSRSLLLARVYPEPGAWR